MGKWLLAGGLVVFVLVLLLWREMRPMGAEATTAQRDDPRAAPASPRGNRALAAAPAEVPPIVTGPGAAEGPGPARLDPRLEELARKVDETVPRVLTRNAAMCYEGRHGSLHRNQKLSLRYKVQVVSGEVQIRDVTIKESTLEDAALETCLLQAVQRSTWKDDQLPDVAVDDELVLRPERGMKKFWQDNLDHVGAGAPRQ